ncbi:tRNA glutamyl-Q(34) synthetase GluQRS [Parashewanella tropica]|uniref:tRNA glutamyl-Q(34) synthetase GluQRS n=1 Tax=Parashewanella tropica TaxID=2547970 RepID=UPI00105A80B5|nr:tRNA glutamyl-Q(34) synthetase GluQRS [Parashewanella tropica]
MSPYIGRFAPSPSGSLHFGSLVAALGSYLRARSLKGQWLLRMEDIDPPREIKGAADDILKTLDVFGLHWDGEVLYQSQRQEAYQDTLNQLLQQNNAYYCQCTRKVVREMGGIYDGRCKPLGLESGAIRLVNTEGVSEFVDELKGKVKVESSFAKEDFIIKRSDGLFAYQLAVVLDDAHQGITEVVRGSDLLEATCRQLSLFQSLNLPSPKWLHLPLASTQPGFKLSKQNAATAVDSNNPQKSLIQALAFLGQPKVATSGDIRVMLAQAVEQFQLDAIPKNNEILIV